MRCSRIHLPFGQSVIISYAVRWLQACWSAGSIRSGIVTGCVDFRYETTCTFSYAGG